MAVTAPPRRDPARTRRAPAEAARARADLGQHRGVLVVLTAISAYLRTKYLSGQFWEDEAITTGIASHSLSAIPGVLRHDGSPPLFYLLLHVWISVFGASESATHALSLVFGLLCIPAGMWAGWSLFGRRAGLYMAVLCAFSTFLTAYATGDPDVRADGVARDPRDDRVHPCVRLSTPGLSDPVRGLPGADALHARVGPVLRRRHGGRADPDLARQRRSPRDRAGRRARLRRRRHPVPARGCRTSSTRRPTPARRGRRRSASASRSCCRATCSAATGSRSRCWRRSSSGSRRCSPSATGAPATGP